jgi:hypothetical protein
MSSEPFLAQISRFAFNFNPRGWLQCNGQSVPINQHQAVFALLGTQYGGNGVTTFQLPNFQGRVPMHFGNSGGLNLTIGQIGGESAHTLTQTEIPAHSHTVNATNATPDQTYPSNNLWAKAAPAANFYTGGNVSLAPGSLATTGGSQGHNNMSPYLTLNFCIAMQGIFPSRN